MPIDKNALPYRLGVGMMIINNKKEAFIGRRNSNAWQMPQGGIEIGETPSSAAMREMEEEIGCNDGRIIAESQRWYCYDIPLYLIPRVWNGSFRGQKQKWFLINFTGSDSDINVRTKQPEFRDWKWIRIDHLSLIIVPFKKRLYKAVVQEFSSFL